MDPSTKDQELESGSANSRITPGLRQRKSGGNILTTDSESNNRLSGKASRIMPSKTESEWDEVLNDCESKIFLFV